MPACQLLYEMLSLQDPNIWSLRQIVTGYTEAAIPPLKNYDHQIKDGNLDSTLFLGSDWADAGSCERCSNQDDKQLHQQNTECLHR